MKMAGTSYDSLLEETVTKAMYYLKSLSPFSSTSTSAGSMKMAGTSYDSLREVGDDATFRDNRREGAGHERLSLLSWLPAFFILRHFSFLSIDYLMYLTL